MDRKEIEKLIRNRKISAGIKNKLFKDSEVTLYRDYDLEIENEGSHQNVSSFYNIDEQVELVCFILGIE